MATRGAPSAEGAPRGTVRHVPVLLPQVLQTLALRAGEACIDATFGAGGYSEAILAAAPATRVLGIDRDPSAIAAGQPLVGRSSDRLTLVGVMYTAARGASCPAVGGPITRWHDHESCRDPATRAKLDRPVDGACPEGQVYRRSGEMMHVWFTDDLATAFARRAPVAALRAAL